MIHLYESDVEACMMLNHFLGQLAPVHKHVKFLKIVASDAQQNWQRKALPTLLIYKGGMKGGRGKKGEGKRITKYSQQNTENNPLPFFFCLLFSF